MKSLVVQIIQPNGNVKVVQEVDGYHLILEIEGSPHTRGGDEDYGTYETLEKAMKEVANNILVNCETGFYEE